MNNINKTSILFICMGITASYCWQVKPVTNQPDHASGQPNHTDMHRHDSSESSRSSGKSDHSHNLSSNYRSPESERKMSDLINSGNPQADAIANAAIPVAMAIAAASSPQAAAAVAAIQAILPVMQAALKANSAGQVSDQAIVDMWNATTSVIVTTHQAWAALDAADAAKAV